MHCYWSVSYTLPLTVHIGCKSRTIDEWDALFAPDLPWFKVLLLLADGRKAWPDAAHLTDDHVKQVRANYLAVRSYLVALNGR
jgi:hypothetical protein